jgi:hypothetical protein
LAMTACSNTPAAKTAIPSTLECPGVEGRGAAVELDHGVW